MRWIPVQHFLMIPKNFSPSEFSGSRFSMLPAAAHVIQRQLCLARVKILLLRGRKQKTDIWRPAERGICRLRLCSALIWVILVSNVFTRTMQSLSSLHSNLHFFVRTASALLFYRAYRTASTFWSQIALNYYTSKRMCWPAQAMNNMVGCSICELYKVEHSTAVQIKMFYSRTFA